MNVKLQQKLINNGLIQIKKIALIFIILVMHIGFGKTEWVDIIKKLHKNFKDSNGWNVYNDCGNTLQIQNCDFQSNLLTVFGGSNIFGKTTEIRQSFTVQSNQIRVAFKFYYINNQNASPLNVNQYKNLTYIDVKIQQQPPNLVIVEEISTNLEAKCDYNNVPQNTQIFQVNATADPALTKPQLMLDVIIKLTSETSTCIQNSWGINEFIISYFQCHYSCQLCEALNDQETGCTSCPLPSSFREQTVQISGSSKTCPCISPHFDSGNTQCSDCHASCKTCNGSLATDCQSCPPEFYLYREDNSTTNGTCPCKFGFFDQSGLQECQRCSYSCADCQTKATNCLSCPQDSNRILTLGECPCQTGFFDGGTRVCQPCHFSCESCAKNATFCTTCSSFQNRDDFVAVNNTCPCTLGFYEQDKSICQACHISCLRCDGQLENQCLECPDAAVNFRNVIDQGDGAHFSCPCLESYFTNQKQQCDQCHYSCKTCEKYFKLCTTCQQSSGLWDAQGNSIPSYREFNDKKQTCNCMEGYFDVGKAGCLKCNKMCRTCEKTQRYCITCKENQYLFEQMNLCICNKGFYTIWDDYTCQPCSNHCVSCDKRADLCVSCDLTNEYRELYFQQCICSQKLMRREVNGTCQCMIGYYETVYKVCFQCDQLCRTCENNATNCTSCRPGNYWTKNELNTCVCMEGYYLTESLECRDATLGVVQYIQETNGVYLPEIKLEFTRPLLYDETIVFNSFKVEIEGMIENVDFNVMYIAYEQQQQQSSSSYNQYQNSFSSGSSSSSSKNMKNLYGIRLTFDSSFIRKRQTTINVVNYDKIVDMNGVPLMSNYKKNGIQSKIGPYIKMSHDQWSYENMINLSVIQKKFFQSNNYFNRIRNWLKHIQILSYKFTFLQVSLLLLSINTVLPCNFFIVVEMFAAFIWGETPCWQTQNPKHGYSYFSMKVGESQNKFFVSQALYDLGFSQDYLSNNAIGFFLILFFTGVAMFYKKMEALCKLENKTYLQEKYQILHVKAHSLLIWTFESGFLVNWVAIFLNISNYNSGSIFSVFSYMAAYCMMFYEAYFYVQVYKVINLKDEKFNQYPFNIYQAYTNNLKIQDDLQTPFIIVNFNLICQVKKFLVAFLLVFIQDSLAQVIVLWLIHLIFLVLRIRIFPFKTNFDNWSRIALEGMLVAIYSTLFLYQLHIKPIAVLEENQTMSDSKSQAMLSYGDALVAFFIIFAFLCLFQDLLWLFNVLKVKIQHYLRMNYKIIHNIDNDHDQDDYLAYQTNNNDDSNLFQQDQQPQKQVEILNQDDNKNKVNKTKNRWDKEFQYQQDVNNNNAEIEQKEQKQPIDEKNIFWQNNPLLNK